MDLMPHPGPLLSFEVESFWPLLLRNCSHQPYFHAAWHLYHFHIPVTFLCDAAACSHILHIQHPLIHSDINRQSKKKKKKNLLREIYSNLWLRSVFCTPPKGIATTQSSAGVESWLLISKTTSYKKKAEDIIDFFKAELYEPETAVEQT